MSILNLILAMIIYCFLGGLVAIIIFLIDKEYIEEFENCEVFLMFLTWPSFITIYIARIIIAIVEQFKGGGTDG